MMGSPSSESLRRWIPLVLTAVGPRPRSEPEISTRLRDKGPDCGWRIPTPVMLTKTLAILGDMGLVDLVGDGHGKYVRKWVKTAASRV